MATEGVRQDPLSHLEGDAEAHGQYNGSIIKVMLTYLDAHNCSDGSVRLLFQA